MYIVTVLLLCVVLPVGSVVVDHAMAHAAMPWLALLGKWFVFWSGGVRLVLAGLRQLIQPGFTSKEIFGIQSDDPLPLVRELGVANLAAGIAATASISTTPPFGSAATCTVDRAGRAPPMACAYTSFMASKSAMFVRYTVVFTTSAHVS